MSRAVPLLVLLALLLLRGIGAADLLVEINAFRAEPLAWASLTGLSADELRGLWPEGLGWVLEGGLPSLTESPELSALAEERARARLDAGLDEAALPDLASEADRFGYDALIVDESYALLAFETPPPEGVEELLRDELFRQALLGRPGAAAFLFPCYGDVGLALVSGEVVLEGEVYHAFLLEVVFAVRRGDEGRRLVGRVLRPSPKGGEVPVPGVTLSLRTPPPDDSWAAQTQTFPHGRFCFGGYPLGWLEFSAPEEGVSFLLLLPSEETQSIVVRLEE